MKDPNLSELVRTCIRCWLYLVPQAFLGIHLFDMFMRRKNSIKPLMIWQLLRVFLIGGISDIILRGYYGDESWWGILMMFCSVVIMIANTVLIYYTFEGSLPKVVLGAMLAADPGRFVPGTQITLTTVSARSADRWTFTVEGPETLDLPAGPTPALKLLRLPRKDYDQKAELWVAPGLGYLPVRIKLTQANGDFADLLLRASSPP